MSTAPAPGTGVPADQAFVNNLITQSTTAGPWIDINTNYLLTSAYLVFFMHCGFAMVSCSCTFTSPSMLDSTDVAASMWPYHESDLCHSALAACSSAAKR